METNLFDDFDARIGRIDKGRISSRRVSAIEIHGKSRHFTIFHWRRCREKRTGRLDLLPHHAVNAHLLDLLRLPA